MSPQADRQEASWTGACDRARGRDRRRYRHDTPPFGHDCSENDLPVHAAAGAGV